MSPDLVKLPPTVYIGFQNFGHFGVGNCGDFVATMPEAVGMLNESGSDARILRIDFSKETGLPTSVCDVTDELRKILNENEALAQEI